MNLSQVGVFKLKTNPPPHMAVAEKWAAVPSATGTYYIVFYLFCLFVSVFCFLFTKIQARINPKKNAFN
jgi:hypothetical protein